MIWSVITIVLMIASTLQASRLFKIGWPLGLLVVIGSQFSMQVILRLFNYRAFSGPSITFTALVALLVIVAWQDISNRRASQ